MNWSFFLKLAAKVLSGLLDILSPEIRSFVEESVVKLYARAVRTDNPTDDMFVEVLAELLSVDLPEA